MLKLNSYITIPFPMTSVRYLLKPYILVQNMNNIGVLIFLGNIANFFNDLFRDLFKKKFKNEKLFLCDS